MSYSKPCHRGFSLIELMVSLAVLAFILVAAVPSFSEFRQRSALRGATDQIISFWANARFEALKRNQPVKVGLVQSGNAFCMGAALASSTTDTVACDCFSANACDVSRYPVNQAEWRGVLAPAAMGNNGDTALVIDPKRGGVNATGFWELRAASGAPDYRLNARVDMFGRMVACEPAAATAKMPQYSKRHCN